MGKKDLLSNILYSGMLLPLIRGIRTVLLKEVRILAYHRIYNLDECKEYKFDADLISANSTEFEWQVKYVLKNYNPITFRELIRALEGKRKLPLRPLLITFDDGFEDNYVNAFPILKKYRVPATIFISTDYIGQEETFWFDKVVYLLNVSKNINLSSIPESGIEIENHSRNMLAQKVLGYLKKVPNAKRLEVLENLIKDNKVDMPKGGFAESRPLNWEQVIEMASEGIEFGSHTCTHPILSRLSQQELGKELADSRQKIEAMIGKACEVIAYPVGGKGEYDERTVRAVKDAGYRMGMTYRTGTNILGHINDYEMRRLHVETYVSRARFASMLSLPTMFG